MKQRHWQILAGIILIHLAWLLAALAMQRPVLPTPIAVYANLPMILNQPLGQHVAASMFRVLAGLLIAALLGIPLGLALASPGHMGQWLGQLTYLTYPVPKTVLLPVLMLLFGLGDPSKISLIVLIVIYPIILSTRDAVLAISDEAYHIVQSLGVSRFQRFYHVTLPAILPGLLTSVRLSIGTALSILFFIEAYGTHSGLGYFILDAWSSIDYLAMYAGILMISLTGLILFVVVDALENRICRWNRLTRLP